MSIFISSTPTIERDDLVLLRELLKKNTLNDIEIQLPGFENKKQYFTNTGRASLYIIFKALDISNDDEVIIQSFTCMAVVVPLIWLNIKPVYADININTYNISLDSIKKRVTEKTRAIIVQHTFGIPAQIDEIKEYINDLNNQRTKDKKIYLIEDCAHCLNIKKNHKYLGEYGHIAFFSFGQDKVVSTTQGGCIVVNDREIEKRIETIYKNVPQMSVSNIKYNLRYPLLWDVIKKLYYKPKFLAQSARLNKFTLGKFLILLFRLLGLIKSQASTNQFGNPQKDVYRLSIEQKHLLKNQLDKIHKLTEHRGDITKTYSKLLGLELEGSLIRYPILVDSPPTLKRKLQEVNVIAGNWYNYPIIPKGIDLTRLGYHLGSCPNTEYIMEHIINLPTTLRVKNNEAIMIGELVKKYLLN
jgi:dTDP-4-amino-4,6-dideoxygalactose transaminase